MRKLLTGHKYFRRYLISLVIFKYMVLVLRAFVPLGLPEIWRQYDTLGVAYRYWLRFTFDSPHDNLGFLATYIYPAVLNSGDSFGIVAAELPILNILASPFFMFGIDLGRPFAFIFLISLGYSLMYVNTKVWRKYSIMHIPMSLAIWLLPVSSLGVIWSGKFMPDFIAFNLILLSIGIIWDVANFDTQKYLKRISLSILLATIALLLKPPVVITFALFLFRIKKTSAMMKYSPIILVSTLCGFLYFTLGIDTINQYNEIGELFFVKARPVFSSLKAYFSNYRGIANLLWQEMFFAPGAIIIAAVLFYDAYKNKKRKVLLLWLVLALQLITIGALAGNQFSTHPYYNIGATIVCALLFVRAYRVTSLKFVKILLLLGLLVRVGERASMDARGIFIPSLSDHRYGECADLRKKHREFPWQKNFVFRSPREHFPFLGICFGERQGSVSAKYGFDYRDVAIPAGCVLTDKSKHFQLLYCR